MALKKNNAIEICLEVLTSIRQRKPDWPFEFVECLKSIHPVHSDNGQYVFSWFSTSYTVIFILTAFT